MGKNTSVEADEARLHKKVQEKRAGSENPEGDAALRALHKHLKRVQRKRRRLALRKEQAAGKKPRAETSAEATPAA
ncbi:MAG: hypothetical protein ACE5NA_05015 [Nitrospiraceae bacterium]